MNSWPASVATVKNFVTPLYVTSFLLVISGSIRILLTSSLYMFASRLSGRVGRAGFPEILFLEVEVVQVCLYSMGRI